MKYLSQDDDIPGGFPGMASFRRKDMAFPPVAILSMSWKKKKAAIKEGVDPSTKQNTDIP